MTGGAPDAVRAKVWIVILYATLGLTRGQGPVTPQAFGNLGFGPILRPGELAGGQSVPLCDVTYRMLGQGEMSALPRPPDEAATALEPYIAGVGCSCSETQRSTTVKLMSDAAVSPRLPNGQHCRPAARLRGLEGRCHGSSGAAVCRRKPHNRRPEHCCGTARA